MFQQFHLFGHLTALQNCTLALRKVQGLAESEARERAGAALEEVGLAAHADKRPAALSGGRAAAS